MEWQHDSINRQISNNLLPRKFSNINILQIWFFKQYFLVMNEAAFAESKFYI